MYIFLVCSSNFFTIVATELEEKLTILPEITNLWCSYAAGDSRMSSRSCMGVGIL